jgi:predicted ATP-dependent endonuclease of OLD family
MIKIINLEIKNFRSCINTKVEINEYLTTLIGVNGVGKSNILNSIQLLKKPKQRNRYIHIDNHKKSYLSHSGLKFDFKINEEIINLRAKIYYETNERNIDEVFFTDIKIKKLTSKKWFSIDSDLYELGNRFRYNINNPHFGIHINSNKLNSYEAKISIEIIKYLSNISYYSATQFSDPTKSPVSIELEDSRPIGINRLDNQHSKFIYDLFYMWKNDKKSFNRYIDVVNKNGIGIVNDINFTEQKLPSSSYEVISGGKIKKIERSKNIIIPSISVDGLSLSPNQLSEGTFKTLALIFYIINDRNDLLLIEEPEVCIHHGLLNSIIELIKIQSKNKQIIISTHSDYVLDKLKPENILLVNRSKEKGTTAKLLSKSMSKNQYAALKEYLSSSGNLGEYWKEGGFE